MKDESSQSLVESKRSKVDNIMDKSEADSTKNKLIKINIRILVVAINLKNNPQKKFKYFLYYLSYLADSPVHLSHFD